MMKNKWKYLILAVLVAVFSFSYISNDQRNSQATVRADDITVTPYHRPTSDPLKILFVWLTSGYALQPQSQYTYVDHPKTLYTDSALSFWEAIINVGARAHYTWYKTTDNGKTWNEMKGETGKNLTISPTEEGSVSYQQEVRWYKLFYVPLVNPNAYSKVATIKTLPDPITAEKLDVTVDDDYLYNNQSDVATTFAHGTPTPENATGEITWSIDNPDLATIDANTGLITANNSGKSGTVTITGSISNNDTDPAVGTAKVKIGGGLDDQTVDEGQTATFKVLGNFAQAPDSVVWHKIAPDGKDTTVSSGTSMSYTTDKTTYKDDGTKFYAVMKISSGGQSTSITTNSALLTVNFNYSPDVKINSTIVDHSYDDHNDANTTVNNVVAGDELTESGTVSDSNVNSKLKIGSIIIDLPVGAEVSKAYLDGQEEEYSILNDPDDPSSQLLMMHNIDFSTTQEHSFEVNYKAGDFTKIVHTSTPRVSGFENPDTPIDGDFLGNSVTVNFTTNKLDAVAGNVSYGELTYSNVGKPVDGSVDNDASELLSIQDNRRDRVATKIYLSQSEPFKFGASKLNADLRFYDSDDNFTVLTPDEMLISDNAAGDKVNSIGANEGQSIWLYIYHGKIDYGQYETSLDWTIVNSA
ncbi:Ig-like domain-containing protein [Companilactobacillus mishanensis]|uniref:Ig-like domain-containing protein n=1 Tax=Companilactobacillus mishanensis TaxID=2486008 RepID=UPI001296FF6A|nr:Ig-like domain-containing protein [Companilactobacillus mishanensis]MQS89095.1 hypothetical protein [Companilactobacillus mishanensis]